ncbi:hypothetical protein [Chryseobacterium salviniae]|uniref:Uncharacterized protein n=1 Tax=Chryseobacterium salviniae TaxID=3101750 RepID=A0ABU6HUG3_9FLAO|nr:hypothetical protein [Chryseobacterium sp. T9W2-O]MEC3876660.1 hypothetical protein [Chryseobacterium sp. T9W2-O]
MVFKESRNLRNFISRLLFGIYFLALLSQNFHSHSSEDVFKNFSFHKSENALKKNVAKEHAADCLACHFLVAGNTLVPEEFGFSFENYSHEVKQIILIQEKIWSYTKFTFQLRGPPAIS